MSVRHSCWLPDDRKRIRPACLLMGRKLRSRPAMAATPPAFRRESPRAADLHATATRATSSWVSERHITLVHFRFNRAHRAARRHGEGSNKTARRASSQCRSGRLCSTTKPATVFEFTQPDQTCRCRGGRGGRERALCNLGTQAPREHEEGVWPRARLRLELKLADVGLVDIHVGKSTLTAHLGGAAKLRIIRSPRSSPTWASSVGDAKLKQFCGRRHSRIDRRHRRRIASSAPYARGYWKSGRRLRFDAGCDQGRRK